MPEFRHNPITGHWVILAENRGGRPQEVDVQQIVRPQSVCVFCEGHEERTPDEVFAIRAASSKANGPGWRVRVVPNKFPALEFVDGFPTPLPYPSRREGVEAAPGAGVHEIVIESPRHLSSITELADEDVGEIFEAYRQRLAALRATKKYRSAVVFKNGGPTAGATLVHLHSQLIAFQIGGPVIGERLVQFENYRSQFGKCPLCQTISELAGDERSLVAATENFAAFCPFASRFAYEMWIAPRRHVADFDRTTPESLPN